MNIYEPNSEVIGEEPVTEMTLEEYQAHKEACEDLVEKAKAAAKLVEDPNFNLIIMQEYFTKEPQRLGSLMATGRLNKQNFDGCVEDLRSIGHLRTFLQDFIAKGNIAKEELEALEEARQQQIQAEPVIL